MTMWGKVLSVTTKNLGEPVTAAAIVGATTLNVADAATFDELGGILSVGGQQLPYVSIDADLDTITLATALTIAVADDAFIELYPPSPVKVAQVDMLDGSDMLPVTVPHALLDRLPDGLRAPGESETVQIEQRGTYEYLVADVSAEDLDSQSLDFEEGEAGVGLSDTRAQMTDVSILGQLGADSGSFDTITLAGSDLAETLAPIPKSTKYAVRGTDGLTGKDAGPTVGTTEIRVFTFTAGNVTAGRLYEIGVRGFAVGSVSGDSFYVRVRPTIDGSEPTTSTPTTLGSRQKVDVINARAQINNSFFYAPATDGLLRYAITLQRMTGTGTLSIGMGTADVGFSTWCTDLGVDSDSTTALQQTAYSDGSGADNVPLTTFTKTFSATWSVGIGDYTTNQDNTWFWVGTNLDYSSGCYGLVGFDYTAIIAALANCVTPISLTVRMRPKYRKSAGGLDFRVLTHTNTSAANAHVNFDGNQFDWTANSSVTDSGFTKANAAPNVLTDIPLNTTIFNQFKTGTRRGVGFAGISGTFDDSSGTIYGDGTNQVQLIFKYQGTS